MFFAVGNAHALLLTNSANYSGAVPIVDSSSATKILALGGAGMDITDVTLMVDITKSGSWIDAFGNPTGGGFTYNSEIVMRLTSPGVPL